MHFAEMTRWPYSWILVVLLACVGTVSAQRQPHASLKEHAGLSDQDLDALDKGEVVSKVLETNVDNEVAVFGAVWIEAPISDFIERQKNIEAFEGGDQVLGIKKLSDPPKLTDFSTMTFPEDDLRALSNCEVGNCDVKADAESLARIQADVDWKAPNAFDRANGLIHSMLLEGVHAYLKGGNSALGEYRDKKRPTYLKKEFEGLIANSPYLLQFDPQFHDYLLNYPKVELPGAEGFIYWSKVQFGLKPTVRLSHVVIYPRGGDVADVVIASKMLYASHYFHSGLELKYLVKDSSRPSATGFYLISVNRSRSDGLTGFFGGIVKRTGQSRARDGLAAALAASKKLFESASH